MSGECFTAYWTKHPVSRPALTQLTTLCNFSGTKSMAFRHIRLWCPFVTFRPEPHQCLVSFKVIENGAVW